MPLAAPKNCPGAASRPWGLPPGIHPQPCRGPNLSPGAGFDPLVFPFVKRGNSWVRLFGSNRALMKKHANTFNYKWIFFQWPCFVARKYHEKISDSTTKKLRFYQQECGIPSLSGSPTKRSVSAPTISIPKGNRSRKLKGWGRDGDDYPSSIKSHSRWPNSSNLWQGQHQGPAVAHDKTHGKKPWKNHRNPQNLRVRIPPKNGKV